MLLLTGPPGSGKTRLIVDRLRQSLGAGGGDVRLLVPTATMSEHLRNEMAREGYLVPPHAVETLWRFVDSLVPEPKGISDATLDLVVREALEATDPLAFRRVRGMPGFRRAVARVVAELDATGLPVEELARVSGSDGKPLFAVAARVRGGVARRGLAWRSERFRAAARRITEEGLKGTATVLLDGFFTFTRIELELIRALASRVDLTVTLPSWTGSEEARQALREMGLAEESSDAPRGNPERRIFRAPTADREAEEIACRILDEAADGRPFREMGIIVRSRAPYVPVLRRALERFGIPARYYFGSSVAEHPAVRGVIALVEALLGGWDHETALAAIRLHPASESLDRFEHRLMENLPDDGLDAMRGLSRSRTHDRLVDVLAERTSWAADSVTAAEWSERLCGLAAVVPLPEVADRVSFEQAEVWKAHATALRVFREPLGQVADDLQEMGALPLAEYWPLARAALESTTLRVDDRRRNVVHVMDAYEARQWELPVVFMCGLVEGLFPQHHHEDPLVGDATRHRLRRHGVHLRTSGEREAEEQFLFELATTRGTERLILSCPENDRSGEETLPSFLLEEVRRSAGIEAEKSRDVRPRPRRPRAPSRQPKISAPDLLTELASRHACLSASAIESFLQCPFGFFAEKTLRLKERPKPPDQRLDPLLEGQIAHRVLAEIVSDVDPGATLPKSFERAFGELCDEARVPEGYRRETARLELLANLQRFVEENPIPLGHQVETEEEFELALDRTLAIRGRIDRADFHFGLGVLIVDYKYTRPDNLRGQIADNVEGRRVQAGLYLLAARECFHVEPVGMLFCAVNRGPEWRGWHRMPELLGPKDSVDERGLDRLIETARSTSSQVSDRIRQGEIAPDPAEGDRCSRCRNYDICRVGTPAVAAGGGAP